jgi:hypothetical protein
MPILTVTLTPVNYLRSHNSKYLELNLVWGDMVQEILIEGIFTQALLSGPQKPTIAVPKCK